MDALRRLVRDGLGCCSFFDVIVADCKPIAQDSRENEDAEGSGVDQVLDDATDVEDSASAMLAGLNYYQRAAVESCDVAELALIWGPPGMPHVYSKFPCQVMALEVLVKLLL